MTADVTVRARAPLRLGLAGGGTDVSPYCDLHGGYVLNATIDRYAYAVIRLQVQGPVSFVATDLGVEDSMPLHQEADVQPAALPLHRAVYRRMIRDYNGGRDIALSLVTFCDAPAGSGLGSSSTLVVAMVRAFVELLNLPLDDYAIAHLAYQIERSDCGQQGGRQDQYSAVFGGFNFMEFNAEDRVLVNALRVKNWIVCELEANLLLFYTGVSRASADIIADQIDGVSGGAGQTMDALHGLKRDALKMKECLLRADFAGIVESMRQGWENKKLSARSVSTSHIDEIYEAALAAGALAGKVSGAGGGGYMMFFVPPTHRMQVMRKLGQFSGQVSNCHFTSYGSQAWKV